MTGTGRLDQVISNIEDIEKAADVFDAATSVLQLRANEVRQNRVNWQSYLQGQMISDEEYQTIVKIDNNSSAQRNEFIKQNPLLSAKTFISLIGHISKDQTVQYILTLIDDILQEDKQRVNIFWQYAQRQQETVWGPFTNLLHRPDGFIANQSSRILAKLACWSQELMDGKDLNYYLNWLKDQMRHSSNEYLQTVARCLQLMLRIDSYRVAFVGVDGIGTIMTVLAGNIGFQMQYQLIFCLWCLTFNADLATKMSKYNVLPILADVLHETGKEKVTRIIVATFRNVLEKPKDRQIVQEHCLALVQCKVIKQIEILNSKKFDDPDIVEDIEYLNEILVKSVQDLSSFDEYTTEIKSGRLEWSPVHKTERFWRENAIRLNEKNYELLKILIKLLESSRDPLVLSVAAHDVGEYVRHYPRGKQVIEQLGGKQIVMQHLTHEDPNVRYEALLAVQKLMVHNWEYLGKKLEQNKVQEGGSVVSSKA